MIIIKIRTAATKLTAQQLINVMPIAYKVIQPDQNFLSRTVKCFHLQSYPVILTISMARIIKNTICYSVPVVNHCVGLESSSDVCFQVLFYSISTCSLGFYYINNLRIFIT